MTAPPVENERRPVGGGAAPENKNQEQPKYTAPAAAGKPPGEGGKLAQLRLLAARGSERCTICGRPFKHLTVTLFGYVRGKPHHVGDCCAGRLKIAWGGSIFLSAAGLSARSVARKPQ